MRSMSSYVIDACDAIDACMYALRSMQIDTCDAIDACMYAMPSMHMTQSCDDCDVYHPIATCVNSSCLLCINAIVGSARLLRHDTPGHESDRRMRRRMLKKLVASLASTPHPWNVIFSCAAGCAASSCYTQCMLIDRDVNCVHVASSSSRDMMMLSKASDHG